MMKLFAQVVINNDAVSVDKLFTYKIPEKFVYDIKLGHRVLVPFGMGNRFYEGFVIGIQENNESGFNNIKSLINILDKEPILKNESLLLFEFMVNRYLCKKIESIRLLIPTGIMRGVKEKKKEVICFNKELNGKLESKDEYIKIVDFIKINNGKYMKSQLINDFNYSSYMINKLISEEYLIKLDEKVNRLDNREYDFYDTFELNEEQQNAFNNIVFSKEKLFLLKGVTGSGKTEVYMRLAKKMLEEEKSTLILVPEISLTPQMIERFKGRFGNSVAVFHSKLSQGERFDEWHRVSEGKVKLVVGARSAIFLPFKNLGLIVVDEEHEGTYKSEQNPKYHTREVAEYLSEISECKVVFASATPSVESYYYGLTDKYKLIELKNRVASKKMPKMKVIDMRQELKNNNKSMFSRELYEKISLNLKDKNQSIIFLNRRGHSTFVSCRQCGYVYKCHHCDISMTYHNNGYLICHYCGTAKKIDNNCPKCGSKYIKYFGAGTEKIEGEIKRLFPKARVLRMDVDTTRNKNSYEKIYNSFKNGEADILIGTQMITKGLDFPNVTLVGVIAADMSLNLPDYRSAERTFQLITQVGGRAGRGDKEGEVIVQTYTPEHYSIIHSMNNDYEALFKEEIVMRKDFNYPPFGKIFLIHCSSKNEELLKNFMKELGNHLNKTLEEYDLEMLGPCSSIISKIKENYRWQIVLKGDLPEETCKFIKDRVYETYSNVYNEIRVSIDINPNSLI